MSVYASNLAFIEYFRMKIRTSNRSRRQFAPSRQKLRSKCAQQRSIPPSLSCTYPPLFQTAVLCLTHLGISGPDDRSLQVDPTMRIQVLDTMLDLGSAEKEQKAAFIVRVKRHVPFDGLTRLIPQRDERVMIVWSDSVDNIVASTVDLEGRLLKLVWKSRNGATNTASLTPLSGTSAFASTPSRMSLSATRKNTTMTGTDIELTEKAISVADNHDLISLKEKELESGVKPAPRPTRTFAAIYIGIAVALSTCKSPPLLCTSYAIADDLQPHPSSPSPPLPCYIK